MEARAHAVLDAAREAGVRYFDAARSYGLAEQFLSSWLTARDIATPQVVIGSKWGYTYTADWQVEAEKHEVKDHSLPVLLRQLGETRALLGAHLDVYQIHSATLESGVLENRPVLEELARQRDAGLVIGLTLTGPNQAETLKRALDVEIGGRRVFATVQATWNLLERSVGPALDAAHAAGLGVIVKEALANGRLTSRNDAPGFAIRRRRLEATAERLQTTVDAVALAAVLARPWVDGVLSGAATAEQLRANLGALRVAWDEAQRATSRRWPRRRETIGGRAAVWRGIERVVGYCMAMIALPLLASLLTPASICRSAERPGAGGVRFRPAPAANSPSPSSPKPRPGLTATSASSSSFIAKSIEPIRCAIPPGSVPTRTWWPSASPRPSRCRCRPSTSTSRRIWYSAACCVDRLLAVPQRHDAGNLNRLEDAVVVIALDRRQGAHHLGVAGTEAEPPAGHVEALAHRGRFDADLLGAGHAQEARGLVAVEADVAVGEVVDDHEAELAGQGHHVDEEVALDDRGRGVVRKIQDQHLRPWVKVLGHGGDVGKEAVGLGAIEADDVARRQGHGVDVDRE